MSQTATPVRRPIGADIFEEPPKKVDSEQPKTAWHFRCVNGQGGAMVLPYKATAEQALMEARSNLGPKVMRVY